MTTVLAHIQCKRILEQARRETGLTLKDTINSLIDAAQSMGVYQDEIKAALEEKDIYDFIKEIQEHWDDSDCVDILYNISNKANIQARRIEASIEEDEDDEE